MSRVTRSPLSFSDALATQMSRSPVRSSGSRWVPATIQEVRDYLHPDNFNTGDSKFQHMRLSHVPSITERQLNSYLSGKGVLDRTAKHFIDAATRHRINPVYLAAHAALETGNGTSRLATGTVPGYAGYYNVYGIGASDSDPLNGGGSYAMNQGWDTVEKAIVHGAQFVASSYVSKGQDTLYKMRWNPANPGTHQYATDIGWAVKNAGIIAGIYNAHLSGVIVEYDLPEYPDQGTGGTNAVEALGPKIVESAKRNIGVPYVWGGYDTELHGGFDCSGFVQTIYGNHGVKVPRTADEQRKFATMISLDQLKPGDLIFFSEDRRTASHVGIFIGNGEWIGSQTSTGVAIVKMDNSYWNQRLMGYGRVLGDQDVGYPTGLSYLYGDTPTGLANGLPLTEVERLESTFKEALDFLDSNEGFLEGHVIDLVTGDYISFNLPDTINDSNPVSWESIAILGRSVPIKGYESSGPRTLSFQLQMFASLHEADGGTAAAQVEDRVAFLRSLTMPDYTGPYVRPPSTVLLSVSKTIRAKCICTSCEVEWKAPYDSTGRPLQANVQLTFEPVRDFPYDRDDVRFKRDIG